MRRRRTVGIRNTERCLYQRSYCSTLMVITNIINDTGGLHNRVTQRIYLQPFTLAETELYFATKKIQLPRPSIVQLYMAFGGIPFYLNEIKNGETPTQSINTICCIGKRFF